MGADRSQYEGQARWLLRPPVCSAAWAKTAKASVAPLNTSWSRDIAWAPPAGFEPAHTAPETVCRKLRHLA